MDELLSYGLSNNQMNLLFKKEKYITIKELFCKKFRGEYKFKI